jgi:cell division protein FtsB
VLLGSLAASVYFGWHAVNGTHGLLARTRLIDRSAVLEREIASLEIVRSRLQRDVALLATDPPHADLVEEHARSILGFVDAGDLIVLDRR